VFIANNITLTRNLGGAFKQMVIRSATDSSMLCVVGNFDVSPQTATFTFPNAGTWYDYLNGGTFTSTGTPQNITLQPGEFHIYLNRNLVNAVVTPVTGPQNPGNELLAAVLPNPVKGEAVLEVWIPQTGKTEIRVVNMTGQDMELIYQGTLAKGKHRISLSSKINNLAAGTYIIQVISGGRKQFVKMIIP
jgi:hypothetical protein